MLWPTVVRFPHVPWLLLENVRSCLSRSAHLFPDNITEPLHALIQYEKAIIQLRAACRRITYTSAEDLTRMPSDRMLSDSLVDVMVEAMVAQVQCCP